MKEISIIPIIPSVLGLLLCEAVEAGELHDAASLGNLAAVRQLLDKGADVNAKDDSGETPLLYAAEEGHTEVAALLIDYLSPAAFERQSHAGKMAA